MTHPTFKDYLINEAKKEPVEKKKAKKKVAKKKDEKKAKKVDIEKLFNPQRFVPKMEKVLDMLIKAAAHEDEMVNELILLEMISIFKEVLVERLEPYIENPNYKERKEDDDVATIKVIQDEIEDVLKTHFRDKYNRPISRFMNMIVGPILTEVQRVGIASAAKNLDPSRYDAKARDAFGHLMRYVQNSVIVPNAEDAEVAQKVLVKWSAEARSTQRKSRKLTKAQRLQAIHNAVAKFQDADE